MLDADGLPKMRWNELIKAGTAFEYDRADDGEETVIFVLLEDRCITPDDVIDSEFGGGKLCLILQGKVRGGVAGDIVRLKGIIDASTEVEL